MRFLISLLLVPSLWGQFRLPYFSVLSEEPGAWPAILSSVGFQASPASSARIFVVRPDYSGSADWSARVESGAVLILEGESATAEHFGFRRGKENVRAASVLDLHRPDLSIVWEQPLEMSRFSVPATAQVFARERWTAAPLLAGFRHGSGAVLWAALAPGTRGHERFPFLLQALRDLGVEPPYRSSRLWAFFDSSYRSRVDLDYLAARWRAAGVAALHVAAWHYYERDAESDRFLANLIDTCHRNGILVYAWLELPHVSDRFWERHPEWREKTALLQDAHLDWRKLMNLLNEDCFREVSKGITDLLNLFSWDGVNLAELYFESLEGISNPARFTPFSDDARALFRRAQGFDPLDLFQKRTDPASRRKFLDFRAGLAAELESRWLAEIERVRRARPGLDLVLTHVDDRFDRGMRDAVGVDASRAMPLLDRHRLTFLVEDPATIWHLGPRRYEEIARRYRELTGHPEQLGIDVNVVERYQDVYPTRQQAGIELFQLVHAAAGAFPRVALYFENSILAPDWPLLGAAAAGPVSVERVGDKLAVQSARGVGLSWPGPVLVDGRAWPATDGNTVWIPAGRHTVESGTERPGMRILSLNGELVSADYGEAGAAELAYRSNSTALVLVDREAVRMEVDGEPAELRSAGPRCYQLPAGQHVVTLFPVEAR